MRKISIIKFTALWVFIFSISVFAQMPEKIEQNLVKLYAEIDENSGYKSNTDYDLLTKANDKFMENLLKYTKLSATLKFNFRDLDKEITIKTSADGKFRSYSWDRMDGGTMHFFETVYQYQAKDGKVFSNSAASEEGDAGGFVSDIYSVDTKLGRVYLVCSLAIGSTQDRFANVGLYRIDGNKLNDKVKIIKTKSGLTNSIGFGYNFFSVSDKPKGSDELIVFDQKTKTLKIAVVIETEKYPNGEVTDKFIEYKFNGTYFVKVN